MQLFLNREEAGKLLAERLVSLGIKADLVLAIPRGGVVTGKAVAGRLKIPLKAVVTKKLGAPGQEELAIGAMGPNGAMIWDSKLMSRLGLKREDLKQRVDDLELKIKDYVKKFNSQNLDVGGKKVLVVDDGVATGATVKAAVEWLRQQQAARVIVAVPVCAQETAIELRKLGDEVVCLETPASFMAVGEFYGNFPQITDEQVIDILHS